MSKIESFDYPNPMSASKLPSKMLLQTDMFRLTIENVGELIDEDVPENIAVIIYGEKYEACPKNIVEIKEDEYSKYSEHVGYCIDGYGWNDIIPNAAKDEHREHSYYAATFCGNNKAELEDFVKRFAAISWGSAAAFVLYKKCAACGHWESVDVTDTYFLEQPIDYDGLVQEALDFFKQEGHNIQSLEHAFNILPDKY